MILALTLVAMLLVTISKYQTNQDIAIGDSLSLAPRGIAVFDFK